MGTFGVCTSGHSGLANRHPGRCYSTPRALLLDTQGGAIRHPGRCYSTPRALLFDTQGVAIRHPGRCYSTPRALPLGWFVAAPLVRRRGSQQILARVIGFTQLFRGACRAYWVREWSARRRSCKHRGRIGNCRAGFVGGAGMMSRDVCTVRGGSAGSVGPLEIGRKLGG